MTNYNNIPIWVPFAVIILLLGISAVLSISSGWNRLSKRFPNKEITDYKKYSFVGMSLGSGLFPTAYGGGVSVRLAPQGFGLSPIILLRLLHPPMFIPWSEVSSCVRDEVLLFRVTKLSVRNDDNIFTFYGKLGEAINIAFTSYKQKQEA